MAATCSASARRRLMGAVEQTFTLDDLQVLRCHRTRGGVAIVSEADGRAVVAGERFRGRAGMGRIGHAVAARLAQFEPRRLVHGDVMAAPAEIERRLLDASGGIAWPLAAQSPRRGRPNVLLSPLLSGSTNEARFRVVAGALLNLDRVLGGAPEHVVSGVAGVPRQRG